MKLDLAITAVVDAETRLTDRLRLLGERHKADHDVYHLTGTLRTIATENLNTLARFADHYGADSPDTNPDEPLLARAREKASEIVGRRPEGGLLLLRDLRELHLLYAAASIDWVILAQGAQAARDAELLAVVTHAHAQTLRGLKWIVTRIKTAAPQVLTS
ncbi:MAG: hypothetical protein WAL22_06160 [Solirubrobacteraceae bacterium]